jgi:hypothetical protein
MIQGNIAERTQTQPRKGKATKQRKETAGQEIDKPRKEKKQSKERKQQTKINQVGKH